MKLAKDGFSVLAWTVAFTLVMAWISDLSLAFTLPLTGLAFWFFRDPDRVSKPCPGGWVSPADGKVVEIKKVTHPYTGPSVKVGIFMNPLSVHVNRVPRAGEVEYLKYVPGKKITAFSPKASKLNERFYLGIRTDSGPSMVVQIAGFLARRIVSRAKRGQRYDTGQRFGMIKLGSKVDVYMPLGVKLKVSLGQKVFAGETIIGVNDSE